MMSMPTLNSMPASTASGMWLTARPNPSTINSSSSECMTPLSGVVPPARTLIRVRMVAPAPGKPENRPLAILPMPWPMSSRFESWVLRVMLSATSDVSSESIEPRKASTSAKRMM